MIVKYTRNFLLKYKYLYKKRSKNIKYDLEKYVSILKKTNNKNEILLRNLTTVLNKLSDQNYNELVQELKKYISCDTYEFFVQKLQSIAIIQPFYSQIYASLFEEFENDNRDLYIEKYIYEGIENYKNDRIKTRNLMKYVGFISKLGFVSYDVVDNIFDKFFKNNKIEAICFFLMNSNPKYQKHLEQLQKIKETLGLRLQFMVEDIENLYKK